MGWLYQCQWRESMCVLLKIWLFWKWSYCWRIKCTDYLVPVLKLMKENGKCSVFGSQNCSKNSHSTLSDACCLCSHKMMSCPVTVTSLLTVSGKGWRWRLLATWVFKTDSALQYGYVEANKHFAGIIGYSYFIDTHNSVSVWAVR